MTQFSPLERRILANQYRILASVNPDEATHYHYHELIEILESGYEGQYDRILNRLEENHLSTEDCQLVEDVLTMVSTMLDHFGTTNAKLDQFKQVGFDGNAEHQHLSYARFVFEGNEGGFPGIEGVVDCHHSTLDRYRKMVTAWKECEYPASLTEADVARILTAGVSLDE